MSKHSKNPSTAMAFSYEERRKMMQGTIKERVGRDSLKTFDSCCLCLNPLIKPMAWYVNDSFTEKEALCQKKESVDNDAR
jgi:hypothetical protein